MDPQHQVFDASLAAARDYANAVLIGPLQQLGGILTDTIGEWRVRNQVKILLRTREMLNEHNIDPKKVLPDVFVPLLEDGSRTSDEDLSEMFSSLLAEHLAPSRKHRVHPSYAKVLAQLTPTDAQALIRFWGLASDPEYREVGLPGGVMSGEWLADRMKIDVQDALLSCLNLARLGLIEWSGSDVPKDHPIPEMFDAMPQKRFFRITEYGIRFSEACNRGKERDIFNAS